MLGFVDLIQDPDVTSGEFATQLIKWGFGVAFVVVLIVSIVRRSFGGGIGKWLGAPLLVAFIVMIVGLAISAFYHSLADSSVTTVTPDSATSNTQHWLSPNKEAGVWHGDWVINQSKDTVIIWKIRNWDGVKTVYPLDTVAPNQKVKCSQRPDIYVSKSDYGTKVEKQAVVMSRSDFIDSLEINTTTVDESRYNRDSNEWEYTYHDVYELDKTGATTPSDIHFTLMSYAIVKKTLREEDASEAAAKKAKREKYRQESNEKLAGVWEGKLKDSIAERRILISFGKDSIMNVSQYETYDIPNLGTFRLTISQSGKYEDVMSVLESKLDWTNQSLHIDYIGSEPLPKEKETDIKAIAGKHILSRYVEKRENPIGWLSNSFAVMTERHNILTGDFDRFDLTLISKKSMVDKKSFDNVGTITFHKITDSSIL